MKNKKVFIIIGIAVVVLILIGGTYALWKKTFSQSGTNTITSSCFKLNFIEDVNSTINIQKGYPLTDEQGLALTPYTFTLNNACGNNNVRYQLNLEIINTTTLDSGYVKVAFNDEVFILNTKETTDKTLSNASTAYLFDSGYFAGGEEKDYTLRIWLDGDITKEQTDTMGKRFEAKVTVTSEYVTEIPPLTASEKLIKLAKTDTINLAYDNTIDNNLRYIGANPNNYMTFNGELWRIIGVMNNIDDGTGKKESRLKIMRDESVGNYQWDWSENNINAGYGVNEWSQAKVKEILNGAYFNRENTICGFDPCDFSKIGLANETKPMINNAIWHTGSNGTESEWNNIHPLKIYGYEHSDNTGKICSSGTYCNDTVPRTTKWKGKVGLMSVSDYSYAVGGTTREMCLNTILNDWQYYDECGNNNWILNDDFQWTITPSSMDATAVFYIGPSTGGVFNNLASYDYSIKPTLYLLSDVQISGGSGTVDEPYTLIL